MEPIKACGVLVLRRQPELQFLLMRHVDRWDLPKGHRDEGESDEECALRELREETGISSDAIALAPDFQFTIHYPARDRKRKNAIAMKRVVIYLAAALRPVQVTTTEHPDFAWFPWSPPHRFDQPTIDGLLGSVEAFFATEAGAAWRAGMNDVTQRGN